MKSKLILFISCMVIAFSLVGCGCNDNVKVDNKNADKRFVTTSENYIIGNSKYYIVIDTKTKNLYLYSESMVNGGAVPQLTPLYDENGQIQKQK